jgi:oligopeptide/dipeptide ABC transporter ATP-binding protein
VLGGSIRLGERELAGASEATWRRIRGQEVGYIPQSALAGPNPVLPIETQLLESLRRGGHSRQEARAEAKRLLDIVHIARPEVVLEQYPHELSGGMRQRVMIAAALAQRPELLVADEPTTGLDVTVQHEIMGLLREIRSELGAAVILVSHDLALIEDVCDRVTVMHAGATVETGTTAEVMRRPNHPYTVALQRSRIDLAEAGEALAAIAGEPPSVGQWPPGCRFAQRCPLAMADCTVGDHPRLAVRTEHLSACIHADRVGELG